ncbi:MAG: TonB family protein, partial [Geminicoccales bacterium]
EPELESEQEEEQAAFNEDEPPPTPTARPASKPELVEPEPKPVEENKFAALLKSVENLDQKVAGNVEQDGEGRVITGEGQARTDRAGSSLQLTSSEVGALQDAIINAWIRPGGTHDEAVPLSIRVHPDGTVISVRVDDPSDRMSRDPAYRAFAESAVRAVQRASPLPIPSGKYALLNDATFLFRP